jgi:NAD+ dependent glucose-6-phosphate dehydrogenase
MSKHLQTKIVFITGTQGRVGRAITPYLSRIFQVIEFDKKIATSESKNKIKGDVGDWNTVLVAVQKSRPDCIVHLAANAYPDSSAEEIFVSNYIGTKNIYEAAVKFRVPKIIFASSLHTLSGYSGFPYKSPFSDGRQITVKDTPNPGNLYGASKVWGEQLAKEYYIEHGVCTICLRIGALENDNKPSENFEYVSIWLSHADATQIFEKAILAESAEPVAIYFAISGNKSPYDIQPTIDELAYVPSIK